MTVESISTKEHGTIAYSLEVQEHTQKSLNRLNSLIRVNISLMVVLIVIMLVVVWTVYNVQNMIHLLVVLK